MLGAVAADAKPEAKGDSWAAIAATIAGGVAGRFLWRRHPVLGILNGMALAGNVARVATKDITARRAIENVGSHFVATAGSLGLPSHPVIGYVAGAATANLFIRRSEGSYLERLDETVLGARRLIGAITSWLPAPTLYAVRSGLVPVKKGQQGDSVTYVQGMVGDSAYAPTGFKADGKFGDETEGAVKKFQESKNLPVTGIVDQATIAAMDAVSGGGGAATVDMTKPDVKQSMTSTALVPTKKTAVVPVEASSEETGTLLFGRPLWQIALAAVGVVVAGGAIYAGVTD